MNESETIYTTDAISTLLPERLKFFRKKARLTTYDVGDMLDKTPSTITLWETGKALPSVETLLKICNIYKINDCNELFGQNKNLDIKKLTKTEKELIFLWRNSDDCVKGAIKTLLKSSLKGKK